MSRGHVLDTLGITVRRPQPYSHKILSRVELLPEEALYLSERGTLQIWNGRDPENAEEAAAGLGSWCDEEFGVKGAVEMSVMEVFGRFMGAEDLSWQRYQVGDMLDPVTHYPGLLLLEAAGIHCPANETIHTSPLFNGSTTHFAP